MRDLLLLLIPAVLFEMLAIVLRDHFRLSATSPVQRGMTPAAEKAAPQPASSMATSWPHPRRFSWRGHRIEIVLSIVQRMAQNVL